MTPMQFLFVIILSNKIFSTKSHFHFSYYMLTLLYYWSIQFQPTW